MQNINVNVCIQNVKLKLKNEETAMPGDHTSENKKM